MILETRSCQGNVSFQETQFKNVSKIAKKTSLRTKIVRLKQRKKGKIVIYSSLWRGKFPGNVKQMHFNAAHCLWQMSALATRADCAVCTPVLLVAMWSPVHLEYQRSTEWHKTIGSLVWSGWTEHWRNYSNVCSSAAPAAPSQPCWVERARENPLLPH